MRPAKVVVLCVASFFFGVGLHALTEDPPPQQPLFGFTKYEKVPYKVEVEKKVEVFPQDCRELIAKINQFHETARSYSEVDAKADILLEKMRGAVASGDVKYLDRLTREYDLLLVTSLGNNPTTGEKGPGKSLYELTDSIEKLTRQCRSLGG